MRNARWAAKSLRARKQRPNTHEDVKPKRYTKAMEPPLGTTHCVAREEREDTKTKDRRRKCPGDKWGWSGSDNMWRLSRLHGFLFWGILRCKTFFSSLHFCTPRNTKMENIIKDWTKQTLRVTFPNADPVSAHLLVLYKQLSNIWHSGRQQSKSCRLDRQRDSGVDH